jgi:hypothetical protein
MEKPGAPVRKGLRGAPARCAAIRAKLFICSDMKDFPRPLQEAGMTLAIKEEQFSVALKGEVPTYHHPAFGDLTRSPLFPPSSLCPLKGRAKKSNPPEPPPGFTAGGTPLAS